MERKKEMTTEEILAIIGLTRSDVERLCKKMEYERELGKRNYSKECIAHSWIVCRCNEIDCDMGIEKCNYNKDCLFAVRRFT